MIVWATSGGGRVAGEALLVIAVLGGGMAAAGIAALLRGGRLSIVGGIAALILPGSLASIRGLGPELIGIGLAAAGIIAYRDGRIGRALALFGAIVLLRETFLLVPLALAALSVRRAPRDAALLVLVPTSVLAGWIVYVRLQLGAWSFDGAPNALDLPFAGLRSLPQEGVGVDAAVLALTAILVLVAFRSRPDRVLSAVLVAHLPMALVFGPEVWRNWYDFSRPLLPMMAVALVIVMGHAESRLPAVPPRADQVRGDGTRATHITD